MPESCFGLMDGSSPIDTLATCRLVSCFAFAVNCEETGRSALAHVNGVIDNRSYEGLIVYCLDGRRDCNVRERSLSNADAPDCDHPRPWPRGSPCARRRAHRAPARAIRRVRASTSLQARLLGRRAESIRDCHPSSRLGAAGEPRLRARADDSPPFQRHRGPGPESDGARARGQRHRRQPRALQGRAPWRLLRRTSPALPGPAQRQRADVGRAASGRRDGRGIAQGVVSGASGGAT